MLIREALINNENNVLRYDAGPVAARRNGAEKRT